MFIQSLVHTFTLSGELFSSLLPFVLVSFFSSLSQSSCCYHTVQLLHIIDEGKLRCLHSALASVTWPVKTGCHTQSDYNSISPWTTSPMQRSSDWHCWACAVCPYTNWCKFVSTRKTMRQVIWRASSTSPKPSATTPSVMVYFNFHSCSWHQEETISDFIAELKKLVEHCEFGNSFNRMLRNRLVCGSNNQRI